MQVELRAAAKAPAVMGRLGHQLQLGRRTRAVQIDIDRIYAVILEGSLFEQYPLRGICRQSRIACLVRIVEGISLQVSIYRLALLPRRIGKALEGSLFSQGKNHVVGKALASHTASVIRMPYGS